MDALSPLKDGALVMENAEVQVTAVTHPIQTGFGTETAVPTKSPGHPLDHQASANQMVGNGEGAIGRKRQLELGRPVFGMELQPRNLRVIEGLQQS